MFNGLKLTATRWEDMYEEAVAVDGMRDSTERMLRRDKVGPLETLHRHFVISLLQYLLSSEETNNVTVYIEFVVRCIHGIKFSNEWLDKGQSVQGRRWKDDYIERLCESEEGAALRAARNFLGAQGTKKVREIERRFKAKHQKVVAARNHVRQLYNLVGVSSAYANVLNEISLPMTLTTVWCRRAVGPSVGSHQRYQGNWTCQEIWRHVAVIRQQDSTRYFPGVFSR